MFNLWNVFIAAWTAWVSCVLTTIGFAVWGIWTNDGRGAVAVIFGAVAFIGAFAMAFWTAEYQPDRPSKKVKLSKESRKKLAEEQQRILLAQQIRELEEEAGVR